MRPCTGAMRPVAMMANVGTSSGLTMVLTLLLVRHYGRAAVSGGGASLSHGTNAGKAKKPHPKVDMAFVRRILRLLPVMVPGPCTPEAGCLLAVAGLLVARTYLDLVLLNLTTTVERAIVGRDGRAFSLGISRFARLCVPLSVVNSVLKYSQSELAILFRQRLTAHTLGMYMEGHTYYGVSNLDGRISNPDQAITQDIERFADSVADLYSNITKPLLDMIIYVRRLADKVDASAPATMIAYLLLSGVVLTSLRKPTAAYTALVQQHEGEYRHVNSRLVTNAEAIAFYGGQSKEKGVLSAMFARLMAVSRRSQQFRHSVGVVDSVVAKYFATVVGWFVVSRPFVDRGDPKFAKSSPAEVYQEYHSSGRMMLNLSAALGRLVLSGRELARLSGFSARVTGLLDVIEDCRKGHYRRTGSPRGAAVFTPATFEKSRKSSGGDIRDRDGAEAVPGARVGGAAGAGAGAADEVPGVGPQAGVAAAGGQSKGGWDGGDGDRGAGHRQEGLVAAAAAAAAAVEPPGREGLEAAAGREGGGAGGGGSPPAPAGVRRAVEGGGVSARGEEEAPWEPGGGVVVEQDNVIDFRGVPLVTPTGEVLIASLDLRLESGTNVLIAGPNGSGKSSLFRVLGGLWPLHGGSLTKPPRSQLFYVPQRPYLTLGTLRDQVIYPHSAGQAAARGGDDKALLAVLELVRLEYLLDREGGWDVVRDWSDVLSGGEKQRLALSRLFYHRPQFAILDECTSAVSVDVEGEIYGLARRWGITLLTVSHRKSLWKHHDHLLYFDGRGGHQFQPMSEGGVEVFGS